MSNSKDFKVKNGIQPTAYHEGLGTVTSGSVGGYLNNLSYQNTSFSFSSEADNPRICFSDNGLKVYILNYTNDTIYQYSLSTAWDVSTASYDSKSYTPTQDTAFGGLRLKDDGTKVYILGYSNHAVYQYTLSTAYDISTASYDSKSIILTSIDSSTTNPVYVKFKPDGTQMYVMSNGQNTIKQYSLSTAWDVSTSSGNGGISVSQYSSGNIWGFHFTSTGEQLWLLDYTAAQIHSMDLSTAWSISTATDGSISASFSEDSQPIGMDVSTDSSTVVIAGRANLNLYQYSTVLNTASLDLSTGSVFEITPTSDIQIGLSNPAASGTVSQATLLLDQAGYGGYDLGNASYDSVSFSVASQDTSPTGMTFNVDGTKLYVLGYNNLSVFQYTLSTAFDITTASYDSISFSVSSQDSVPYDIVFNSNGSKMYILGYLNTRVYQYSLSTNFDLSTASYDSVSFLVSTQDATPVGLNFNDTGSKMYISGGTNDTIYQYTLSTPFAVNTASYDSVSLSVSGQDGNPYGITFSSNGTKLFVSGASTDSVYQYTLSTGFDLSTASYDSVSLSISSQETNPTGVRFNSTGKKMFVIGQKAPASIYQYSTATPATITYPSTLEWPSGTAPTSPAIGETDVITFTTTDGGASYQAVQAIDGAS